MTPRRPGRALGPSGRGVSGAGVAALVLLGGLWLVSAAAGALVAPRLESLLLAAWGVLHLLAAWRLAVGDRWGAFLAGVLGALTILLALLLGGLLLAILWLSDVGLDGPAIGLPVIGIVNGWQSLALMGLLFLAGALAVRSARRARREGDFADDVPG